MGIYDREYIRGESSGTGLFSGVTPVTKSIIVISAVTFLLHNLLRWDSNGFTSSGWPPRPSTRSTTSASSSSSRLPSSTTASSRSSSTCMFLWIIGREMESLYGSRDFLVFYLTSAVVTTLAGLAVAASAGLRQRTDRGPWGPILAVMTLFTLFYPKREFLFVFFIPMPMWVLLAIFIVMPLLGQLGARLAGDRPGHGAGRCGLRVPLQAVRPPLVAADSRAGRFRPRLRIFSSVGYDQARPRGCEPLAVLVQRRRRRQVAGRSRSCPRSSSTPGWTRSSPRSPATATATG